MLKEQVIFRKELGRGFCIESYGVRVKIESNSQDLLDEAREVADKALVRQIRFIENKDEIAEHSFEITRDEREHYFLYGDGRLITHGDSKQGILKFFNSLLRIKVAEHAPSRVFLHAGVVGWRGRAIIMPANSFKGKTTLVRELVRSGAEYYSDEYAVLDENGLVHPYPRMLSVRYFEGHTREKDVSVESLGGAIGEEPIPVGMILLTEFHENAEWRPQILSPGAGIMEMIPHTIPIRSNSVLSLKVLKMIAESAIIAKGPRGDAAQSAKILLSFFDNNIN